MHSLSTLASFQLAANTLPPSRLPAFEREVEAKKFSGVNNEQEITQDLYEEVPEVRRGGE